MYSKAEGKEFGKFELTAGKFFNDAENDKGKLKTQFSSVNSKFLMKHVSFSFKFNWNWTLSQ